MPQAATITCFPTGCLAAALKASLMVLSSSSSAAITTAPTHTQPAAPGESRLIRRISFASLSLLPLRAVSGPAEQDAYLPERDRLLVRYLLHDAELNATGVRRQLSQGQGAVRAHPDPAKVAHPGSARPHVLVTPDSRGVFPPRRHEGRVLSHEGLRPVAASVPASCGPSRSRRLPAPAGTGPAAA